MPCRISIRDVTFTPSTDGVRIVVETDVPCILYCRLSEKEPWIHKKPSLRRGVQFAEDVRFCFTVFEDNEQHEQTETYFHTFWKPSWPVCKTKWLYFWGTISGDTCISTSPIFKYHNDGVSPVPAPDKMDVFNSIEPQLITPYAAGTWQPYDCSHFVNPDSNGVVLYIHHKSGAANHHFGIRKKGQAYSGYGYFLLNSHQWAVVGLDAEKKFEALGWHLAYFDVWAMGYTGRQVKFLDEPHEITPSAVDVWETKDLAGQCPQAVGAFSNIFGVGAVGPYFDIRKYGSTDDHYQTHKWACPFVGLDPDQKCQIKMHDVLTSNEQCFIIGYVVSDIYAYTDVRQLPNWGLGNWNPNPIDYQTAAPRWGILKVTCPSGGTIWGARKQNSVREDKRNMNYLLYVYVHCDPSYKIEYYRNFATQYQYLLAEVA